MRTATTIVLLALVTLASWPARADEAEDERSPAAEAYREGFWQETGSGALEKALELYGKALAAEGSATVRARALYRTAVVLQRMGRAPEAVKALERLSKEFPDQPAVLAEARKRLEEWSAVDLRTSFEEWYARYQFTPEFQAKILELVRSLATAEGPKAFVELLTIGRPALPALRMYADSANLRLRGKVVHLLLLLGEVPSAGALLETEEWRQSAEAWSALADAPAAAREPVRARVVGDEPIAVALRAVLAGREGILAALAAGGPAAHASRLAEVLLPDEGAADPGTVESLEAILLRPDVTNDVAGALVPRLMRRTPASRVVGTWLPRMAEPTREFVYAHLAAAAMDAETFGALAAFLAEHPSPEGAFRLVQQARLASPSAVPAAVLAVARSGLTDWPGVPLGAHGREIVHGVAMTSADDAVALPAWDLWRREGGAPRYSDDLLALAKSARAALVRVRATEALASRLGEGPALDAAFDVLATADPDARTVFGWMLRQVLTQRPLPLGARHFRALQALPAGVFEAVVNEQRARGPERILEVLLEDPTALPPHLFGRLQVRLDDPDRDRLTARIAERWGAWTPEQRRAALGTVFAHVVLPKPATLAFLRERLASRDEDAEVKGAILDWLARLGYVTFADVRTLYDPSDPAQRERFAGYLHAMPLDAEVYAALRPLPHREHYARFLDAGLLDVVAADVLAGPDRGLRARVMTQVAGAKDPAHLPLVKKGLADEAPEVRAAAATAAGLVYDREAITALVGLLDDPAPTVREEALASLEKIKKFEEQKASWREFAEGLK